MEQEAEDVQQEQNAHAVQVGEEPLIIIEGEVMCDDITDDVSYTHNNQELGVDEARDYEEWSSVKETKDGR